MSYTKKIVIIITIKVGVREPAIKSANKFSKMNTNFNLPLLEKYKEYASEAKTLLENANSEYILAKNYDDINDKLLFRQYEILKLFADHQSSSFSYIDLRKLLKKRDI